MRHTTHNKHKRKERNEGQKQKERVYIMSNMVLHTGLEPALHFWKEILSLLCLPIPPM